MLQKTLPWAGLVGLTVTILLEQSVAAKNLIEVTRITRIINLSIAQTNDRDSSYYITAGNQKYQEGDYKGALADLNRAIALDPKLALAYNNRGVLKEYKLNDPQGALADLNRAIALDPKLAVAYSNRGLLKKDKLNDRQGALADYDRAITLEPKFANAYGARGLLKYTQLNDRAGGIADLRQAAKLSRAQENSGTLQLALKILQSWGVGE